MAGSWRPRGSATVPGSCARDRPGGQAPQGGTGSHVWVVLGGGHTGRGWAEVHLAHPQGVKGFAYRRVKNDEKDARIWPTCCGWGGSRGAARQLLTWVFYAMRDGQVRT